MDDSRGRAPARAALAGNPSDGYGGAVLAVAVEALSAEAVVTRADDPDDRDPSPSTASTTAAISGTTLIGRATLVDATVRRFYREFVRDCDPAVNQVQVQWSTTIPRSVGLGGSSAIVLAVLRALTGLHDVTLSRAALAELALSIEVDDLAISAGLQDRVAQCYGGLTFMEFGEQPSYERLDAVVLPPLLLAWRPDAAEGSGLVHGDLRARHQQGDPVVRESMAKLESAARRARAAALAGDRAELARCADESFDARARMLALDPRHVEMIEIARRHGAGANYTGSGGAVICVCEGGSQRDAVAIALAAAGCSMLTI